MRFNTDLTGVPHTDKDAVPCEWKKVVVPPETHVQNKVSLSI
jgi:hypothetical protein